LRRVFAVDALAVTALLAMVAAAPASAEHLCTTKPAPVDLCDDPAPPPGVEALCSNGYTIDFVSRVVNAGPPQTTTFNYVIDGPGVPGNGNQAVCKKNNAISHFSVAWELCAGQGQSDLQFFGSNPASGLITGLAGDSSSGYCVNDLDADLTKFNFGVPCAGNPQPFSVTFWGNVPLGDAEVMFKAGKANYVADVPGPACPEELICDEETGPFPDCCGVFPSSCS
jgi:hypothetical protein